ncbi:PTS mannose/fructose/sorbose/N-acetylgalactosamine transporter subunit IIC [Salmonella enterica]|uniref:PTS mannose/fructose/sorbose/N-acetylgalactosamine transporter subunit IIC n=1 Tax=Salmonella enterica TaxID=28901 RepID=UPI00098FD5FF|nr:PTS sugar transporter subunit IIC [Salmonella enterica]EHE5101774.1 PTS sugar transporter subunit IIC [Salmonella enterica]
MDMETLPLWPAFLVSLVTLFGYMDYMFGSPMINRPIVLAPLVGLALGNIETGILMGATLELVFMGVVTIGSATPPDTVTGSVMGTALAMMTGQGVEIALALALPVAMLTQSLKITVNTLRATRMPEAIRLAEKGDTRALGRLHWFLFTWMAVPMMSVTFISVLVGVDAVKTAIEVIPHVVLDGIAVSAKILPAVGFALLLKLLWSRDIKVFFYLGFLLATLFKLSILGIALLGVIIALVLTDRFGSGGNDKKGDNKDSDEVTIYE